MGWDWDDERLAYNAVILYIYKMKQQEITQSLAFAFQLQAIADRISSQHFSDLKTKQKKKQALSVAYIMSEDGRPILELFGYHLGQKLGGRSFWEMGRALLQVLVNAVDFGKYCETVWPDLGKYERVIPVLFRILNTRGVVPLRTLDLFVQICRKQLHPFIAELKQNVPTSQLKKLRQKLIEECEREDLLGNGYAEKLFLEEIMKRELRVPLPEWPKQLYNPNNVNEINYRVLLGTRFLAAGGGIDRFIKSMFVRKIVRALQRAGTQLKKKGPKKQTKKTRTSRTLRPQKPQSSKHQKLLQKYIESNKPKKTDQPNRNQFMIKSLVEELIAAVVQMKYDEAGDSERERKMLKSVYVTEPEFPEIQYEGDGLEIRRVQFVGSNGLGLFVSADRGYIMDNMKSLKKSQFHLNLSHIFKKSPILASQILDNTLYLLKQNGLLYSWPITGQTFLHQIQTSFLKPEGPPESGAGVCNYLRVKDGLVFVNCTQQVYSRVEIYTLELGYVGVVELGQAKFGLTERLCEEARLLEKATAGMLLDKRIHNIEQYKQLLPKDMPTELGNILCSFYPEQLTIQKISAYTKWILSFKKHNKIAMPAQIMRKLREDKADPQLIAYLLRLGYIGQGRVQDVRGLEERIVLEDVGNRKVQLITLFQDNGLDVIKSQFLTKEEFGNWIAPACLMAFELKTLTESLSYRPDGKVDMSKLFYNEHYRRLSDSRYNRFQPQKYKTLEIPPVCIRQFLPLPASQTLVFTLCFPLLPCFYVVNMLNGQLLNSCDLGLWTTAIPKICLCERNGYAFFLADRSVSLWSPASLAVAAGKELVPVKNWVNLESSQLIDLIAIYELSTILTLTNDCIKIWDFDQMCKKKQFTNIFTLKPGYKAIENKVTTAKNYKKRILLRQTALSLFYFLSPNESIVAGAVSLTKSKKYYIKSFTVNKFNVAINSQKEHYQIPTKLIRELQSMAMRRKNLPPVVKERWMNETEKVMQFRMAELFKAKLNSVVEVAIKPTLKPELQQKIGLLSHSISSIYTRSMFKNNQESKRLQNIFALITIENTKALEQLLQPKFLDLYKINETVGYDLDRMLQDCMSTKEKKSVNRVLYLLSLIQKYSRTIVQAGTKLAKLISEDRVNLDEGKIITLLPSPLPLDGRIVSKAIKLLNSLPQPVATSTKIITSYLPTRYRFLIPRYIKQISTGKPSPQLHEYLSNHYENEPSPETILSRLQTHSHSSIQELIEANNLSSFVRGQLVDLFPLALNCNYSLIEALWCLGVIGEDQAYYYAVRESLVPGERVAARIGVGVGDEVYLDDVAEAIAEVLAKKKHINLPYPKVSYQYFKKQLYNGPNSQTFFFNYLQADRNTQECLSQTLSLTLLSIKKSLSLRYTPQQWHSTLGAKVKLLQPFHTDLLQRFPIDFRIVAVTDLRTALMSLIQDERVYEDLLRCVAYACAGSREKRGIWGTGDGRVEVEGMWVNVNHLLRFIQDYNPMLLDLQSYQKQQKPYILHIPAHSLLSHLAGDFSLLPLPKFRKLLTHNLHPLSLTDTQTITQLYFKQGYQKKINIFQLKSLFPKEYYIFGRYLIERYQRLDFQYRFTVVNGMVGAVQLVQLLGSRTLANYLFGDQIKGLPEFLGYEEVVNGLKKYLLDPAATRMSTAFALSLPPQLLQLLDYNLTKTTSMPVLLLAQLLHSTPSEHPIIICLLKFMTQQSSSAQLIDLNCLLGSIRKIREEGVGIYERYLGRLKERTRGRNLVELFLEYAQPQNLPFTEQDPPKLYSITLQHMSQLLDLPEGQLQWFINLKPQSNIRQFLDHLRKPQPQLQQLHKTIQFFTENCVCRVGVEEILKNVGQGCSFAQFYYRIRGMYKVMGKLDARAILGLYREICEKGGGKFCGDGVRMLCGEFVPVHRKMEWICALHDRQRITNPLQHEQLTLDSQLKIQHLKTLYNPSSLSILSSLKSSLHYPKYLVHRYLNNDPTKLRQLHECVSEKKMEEVRTMLEVYGVGNWVHLDVLVGYFGGLGTGTGEREEGRKFQGDCRVEDIRGVIRIIKENFRTCLDECIPNQPPQSYTAGQHQTLPNLLSSPVYLHFLSSTGEYYPTYHSLLTHAESLLHSKLTSTPYLLRVQEKIRRFLVRCDMTPARLYQLLDFSSVENLGRYLGEVCVEEGEGEGEDMEELGVTVAELIRADRVGLKYPINSSEFQTLLSDIQSKTQKSRMEYQYLYSDLDILGTGYVNLNDIGKYRGSCPSYLSPYVYIPSYIDFLTQKENTQSQPLPSRYQGPILDPPQSPSLRLQIKQKLLKYELPVRKSQKTKLIKPEICLAILSEFGIAQNHQYHQFVRQKFVRASNGLLDLSGVVDWLMGELAEDGDGGDRGVDERQKGLGKLVQAIDGVGGLYGYINKMKKQPKHVVQQFFATLLSLSQTPNPDLLLSTLFPQSQRLPLTVPTLKSLTSIHFQSQKWHTLNNPFVRTIKNMAQMYYTLVYKFYRAHTGIDMHQIYEDVSENGQLTLLTLWRYIEEKGITGYGRAEVNQLFSAIDVNGDLRLSYLEFCQFWMACQQLFGGLNPETYQAVAKIDQINAEVKDAFVELCCVELDGYQKETLDIEDLVKFTNIPNVQKVDYIVRAVNAASVSRGPVSGAFETKIELSKSKLKIIMDKMKGNQAASLENLRQDLILSATYPEISGYLKQGYNADSITKIIVMKYPKLGYEIVQHLHDLTQMNLTILSQKYTKASLSLSLPKPNPKLNRLNSMEELITNIEECYRKHPLKISAYEHREYASSIASGLLAEQVVQELLSVRREINQVYNFLERIQVANVPLYYQLEPVEEFGVGVGEEKGVLRDLGAELKDYPFRVELDTHERALFRILYTLYSKKPVKLGAVEPKGDMVLHREIVWKDTDTVCKSENKVNLLLHANLYNDPQISLIPINTQQSSRFKIQGSAEFKPQYQPLQTLKPLQIPQESPIQLPDLLMSTLKHIAQKLAYCYYKHAVTGLLVIPSNILINRRDNRDIKFANFLSCLALNRTQLMNKEQTVNYVDGIDPRYVAEEGQGDCPPECTQSILTQAIDVFMLGQLVYRVFRERLDVGEVSQAVGGDGRACEEESVWDWHSELHEVASRKIKLFSEGLISQKQYNMWVLLYECSQYDWFMRPRLHQLVQVLDNYFQSPTATLHTSIFSMTSTIEQALILLENNNIGDLIQLLQTIPSSEWNLPQLIKFNETLCNLPSIDPKITQHFTKILEAYPKNEALDTDPDKMRDFLSTAVDFLLMVDGSQSFLVNACFKNLLNCAKVLRYLEWCDQNWKIEEYEVNKKIEKINMKDKLETLHKNSSYYHDISTLVECRTTLSESQPAKRSQTSKKVSISFIQSCLISNNINKIYAVYRSRILTHIYCYLNKPELEPAIISIFQIVTSCFNATLGIDRFRAVDQVYKVMMVISNSMRVGDSPTKGGKETAMGRSKLMNTSGMNKSSNASGQNQSVVSMQDFVNNYYTLSGQECRQVVLLHICRQQLCTLPVLTYLLNELDIGKISNIVLNLTYDKECEKMMRSPVVGGYAGKLSQGKLDDVLGKIREAVTRHSQFVGLGDLATSPFQALTYPQLLKQHLKYYEWYCQLIRTSTSTPLFVNYQINFHQHFQSLLAKSQRIYSTEIAYAQHNENSLQIIRLIIKIHRVMFPIWTRLPCHPDFTAGTCRFLMGALEDIYGDQNLYVKSKINSEVSPDILHILRNFITQPIDTTSHNLTKIAISNGFLQFYCRIIKKQHSLMQKYIDKNVQNIHLTDNYHPEAEFRLICYYLLIDNKEHATEICQILIANALPAYIVQTMLASKLVLDLRFYKANDELVPFRYCHPLRAQAIAMIGYTLSLNECLLKDDIASRLIPKLALEMKILDIGSNGEELENLPERMKWVEALWLLANTINCENERLKYQFVNLRLHQRITGQIDKYPFLQRFFPVMTQTLRNSQMMVSSMARSQVIK